LTRVLALDHGSARCGCAVSDPTGTLATPLPAVPAPDTDAGLARLARMVAEQGVTTVVVGLPVSLSGEEGPQAREARAFATRLAERLEVPVETWDERFTTSLARRTPGRHAEDSRAAAHLLQSYLEARSRGSRT
jgi:putative holliday junction resolvase